MALLDHFHPPPAKSASLGGIPPSLGDEHCSTPQSRGSARRNSSPRRKSASGQCSGSTLPALKRPMAEGTTAATANCCWAPPKAALSFAVDFSRLEVCEVRIFEELGGPQLRAAIELVSPANKDRLASRRRLASKCGGYLKQAVSVIIIDVVTERTANLHADLLECLTFPRATGSRSRTCMPFPIGPFPSSRTRE